MKYVLKWENTVESGKVEYVSLVAGGRFSTSNSIEYAEKFDSIPDALDALVARADATHPPAYRAPQKITIVRVEEVNEPKYREVPL